MPNSWREKRSKTRHSVETAVLPNPPQMFSNEKQKYRDQHSKNLVKLTEEKLTVRANKIWNSTLRPKPGLKHRCPSQTEHIVHRVMLNCPSRVSGSVCSLLYPGRHSLIGRAPSNQWYSGVNRPISGRNTCSIIVHTEQTHQAHSRRGKPLMTHGCNNQVAQVVFAVCL